MRPLSGLIIDIVYSVGQGISGKSLRKVWEKSGILKRSMNVGTMCH